MKLANFVIMGFVLGVAMSAAGAVNAATQTAAKPAAASQPFNPCIAVAQYVAQQCNTPTGPTPLCAGAEAQLKACLAGQKH